MRHVIGCFLASASAWWLVGCLALATISLRAGDMAPDFAKLAPVAACPWLADAARAANLPLAGN